MDEQSRPRPPMVSGPPGTQVKQIGITAPAAVVEHALKEMDQAVATRQTGLVPRSGPVGNIAKAIAAVMANVGTIKKGGFNSFHNYHYARMEDLLQALTPLMGKNGLAVIQNEIEIKTIEQNRIAVTYEFSLFHESGESWPEKPRFTGMCMARTRKGDMDDKAINKCHTAARKYFLLSLFQVPAGDFDDSDEGGDANQRQEQRPVPGPKKAEEKATAAPPAQSYPPQEGIPHKIVLGEGATADQWANAYIRNIGKAKSPEDLESFDKLNDAYLQRISDRYSSIYEMIKTAFERRLADVSGVPAGMPDPKQDPQEAMNWVASQLQTMKTYEAAEAFWNSVVAPHESSFDVVDWGMLLGEWQRNELRLKPPEDDEKHEG